MGTKITALPQVTTPVGTDELPISQDTGLGGRITYKATLDQIKSYVKNSGGGTGSVTNIDITSTDGSIEVIGSPINSSGTISLSISSVELDKLDDGGASGGEILTYNGSTSAWEPGFGGSSGIIPNILVGNGGTTYTLTNYTNDTASNYLVFVGGVAQRPTTDFTISGSSIIFGSNIPSGAQILVYAVINIATLNLDSTPIGTVSWFAASAAPTGYLACSGQLVGSYGPGGYSDLYNVIGDTFNLGGEPADSFRLPDLRGEFIRGWDDGRGVDTGRTFGSNQSDAFQGHWHEFYASNGTVDPSLNSGSNGIPATPPANLVRNPVTDGVNGTPRTASETRPRNVALLPCIKALKTVTGDVSTLNFIEKPASPTNGQVLTFNGSTSTWVASAVPKELPQTATGGQVLTYNGTTSTWVAESPLTTVGNASAGVFVKSEIFNAGQTGNWVCPNNVKSIRITCIGGGGYSKGGGGGGGGGWSTCVISVTPGQSYSYSVGAAGTNGTINGGDTRFNYPAGSSPSINQIWCAGGTGVDTGITNGGSGGSAKWNGFAGFTGGSGSVGGAGIGGNGGVGGKGVGGGGGQGGAFQANMGGSGASWGGEGATGVFNQSWAGGSSGGINSRTNGGYIAGGWLPLSIPALSLLTSDSYGYGRGTNSGTTQEAVGGVIIIEY